MTILGIESSCDETACAIVKDGTEVLIVSNPTAANMSYSLEGSWYLLTDSSSVYVENPELTEGPIELPHYSAYVFINTLGEN